MGTRVGTAYSSRTSHRTYHHLMTVDILLQELVGCLKHSCRLRCCPQFVSFGVSVGPAGVWAALCSGAHFFRASVAGACLALDQSSGCDLVLALYSFGRSFTGHKKVGDLERD